MIEPWPLITNGLWILGLSVVLAAFSYNAWLSGEVGRPLGDPWKARTWRLSRDIGMFLTSLGWSLSADDRWWRKTFWLLLAIVFGWEILRIASRRRD